MHWNQFDQIWCVDFEFSSPAGENPDPICLVAWDILSGKKIRLWKTQLKKTDQPPYNCGEKALFVAYYASAELGCHLALGWPLPIHVLDLFAEFRNLTNGLTLPSGAGLLGALFWFGLPATSVAEKKTMQQLALRGGPWSIEEKNALLDYCEEDVKALHALFPQMKKEISLPHALLRGRYFKAAAHIERFGVPIDLEALNLLKDHWLTIQEGLIQRLDRDYQVFEGRTFKIKKFSRWLNQQKISWPRLDSGAPDLSRETFREMANIHPKVAPLRELRDALSQMRLSKLAVGEDGRNRTLLSAFRARTGRNQPSNSRFIFGPSTWLRGLIRAKEGYGLAYIDWSQQEFGIAAALSEDRLMQEAYLAGDPYLAFAKQSGAIPEEATKASHSEARSLFKACVLAVQYGMGKKALAMRIGRSTSEAEKLLRLHKNTYQQFWRWSESVLNQALLHGVVWTTLGWKIHLQKKINPRFLLNFPMQANGAEMLRLACCLAVEAGIRVCAPVHDALLIEAPLDRLDSDIKKTEEILRQASATILDGFILRSDVERFCYPQRYQDSRGQKMWDMVWQEIKKIDS
ncbi:DNA polymerase [Magnetococcales bacterium HHB-1]